MRRTPAHRLRRSPPTAGVRPHAAAAGPADRAAAPGIPPAAPARRCRTAPRPTATSSAAAARAALSGEVVGARRGEVDVGGEERRRRWRRGSPTPRPRGSSSASRAHGHDQRERGRRQDPAGAPRVELTRTRSARFSARRSSHPVIRNPEITKNTSTPTKPPGRNGTPAWHKPRLAPRSRGAPGCPAGTVALSEDRSDRWLAGVIEASGACRTSQHAGFRAWRAAALSDFTGTPRRFGGVANPASTQMYPDRQSGQRPLNRGISPNRPRYDSHTTYGRPPSRKRGVADAHRRVGAGKAASDMVTLMSTSSQWLMGIGWASW